MQTTQSEAWFQRAKEKMPGGVNSPVRAFPSVGGAPRFICKAKGNHLYDLDGNEYLDYIGSWGPMILGHNPDFVLQAVQEQMQYGLSYGTATALEVEMAELISEIVPCVEMIRMVNSGTEAVMSAVRAARGFTGRDKIIKFAGCYHGHADAMLVKAGSGVMTAGIPDSSGVPSGCTKDTLTAVYNDAESVKALLEQYPNEVACVIVEPVAANMGVVPPKEGFLQQLRTLCNQYGALLIFDEVITGFRLQIDGAVGFYHVQPDLVTYGKIIGAGMPVGAYGGRKEIMDLISPCGPVYQAGTLSGNPVAMAAGFTQLKYLYEHQEVYKELKTKGEKLYGGLKKIVEEKGLPYQVNYDSSLASIFFTDQEVKDYVSAKTSDLDLFAKYFKGMLKRGIHLAPSQFEAMFLSTAHTDEVIDETLEAMRGALGDL